MKKQSVALGLVALGFAAALASGPAAAQSYGRNANDGGLVTGGDYYAPQKPSAHTSPSTPYYGRSYNDGGLVEAQPTQRQLYNSAPEKSAPAHYGRNMNDGGF